jgi:putative ABC transport system ATP-binding protein
MQTCRKIPATLNILTMIGLENVEKYYGETHVLKGISLEVERGEFVAITGSSGSGKSTLLNLIGGMDRPEKGRIVVDGKAITSYAEEQLTLYRRKKIGFIFQFFNLLPNITVFENIRMPLLLNGIGDEERVQDFIRRVGLEGKEKSLPYQLSGGQQQRVAIARALIHDPEIILADEPTGSLDSSTGAAIMDLMKELGAETGKTIVLVTHESYIAEYARRKVRIKDGVLLL